MYFNDAVSSLTQWNLHLKWTANFEAVCNNFPLSLDMNSQTVKLDRKKVVTRMVKMRKEIPLKFLSCRVPSHGSPLVSILTLHWVSIRNLTLIIYRWRNLLDKLPSWWPRLQTKDRKRCWWYQTRWRCKHRSKSFEIINRVESAIVIPRISS